METSALPPTTNELRSRLPELMLRDQPRLRRRIDRIGGLRDNGRREQELAKVAADMDAAAERTQSRKRSVPVISYPAELPVSQRKDEIAAAIRDHQVVIVAGETGSGKTTQIPKICLELGRGVTGQIGHTQPRRLAARTVAERIADELGVELGSAVGYIVRFTDTSSDNTLVKLMTDGILLTELQHDRRLLRYDTLIIDEAHERSLNIDFILGYVRRLLPSRPDLKVIITSATIDPERFSEHFGDAPIVEVSGRTYPVEVRYRPLVAELDDGEGLGDGEARDQVQAITDAVDELQAEGPGDILVFLSGEREIRDTADALTGAGYADLEVLPLYARLSAAEQHKVFQPHRGRRVVLATNVAETSLTVPGIKYVIDPGTARISRYSNRTKVQRLPIEPISQASANQRKGRCGRTSDGICIRLYGEADFSSRPEFTDPEILRTNLASVILQMAALDLGEVAGFPFIDPPDTRQVTDGVRLLTELSAVQPEGKRAKSLTDIGKKLARLPVDPRLGRMIIEAGRNSCAREVLIIAAALSIQDPRERPADAREAADARHVRFAEPGSDFLSLLNLWDYLRDQQRELSGSAFRRMCRREYLHYLRVREWQDVYGQLRQAARELGITVGPDRTPAVTVAAAASSQQAHDGPTAHVAQLAAKPGSEVAARIPADLGERVHKSLLSGLLSHIGMRDVPKGERRRGPAEFLGARNARFAIFPDSVLSRKPPQWVVAAELVETSRLWARVTARIEPEWAEPLAEHLIKREYSEPHWDGRRGAAMALERVSLYGLPLVAGRRVTLSRIDPVLARELFISQGLVEGDWQTHHKFFHHNRQLLADAEELELRARRRGLVADDAALFAFYDRRIPAEVTSARHFDSWWKRARQAEPDLLTLTEADLAGPAADEVTAEEYPSTWGGLALSYEFAPGEADDGVTADVPLAALNQVSADEFSWNVPGLRHELVTELIRTLPKQLRTRFVPAPDVARDVLTRLDPGRGPVIGQLSAELGRVGGVSVPADAFDLAKLPPHLRVTFRVTDDGQLLGSGKDLDQLRGELRPQLRERLAEAAGDLTRKGIKSWDFGALPRVFSHGQVRAYPALRDDGDSTGIALFETPEQAAAAMRTGNRRLLLIEVPAGARAVASRLPTSAKLAMSRHPYRSAGDLVDDCAACAADDIIAEAGGPAWDEDAFARLLEAARMSLRTKTADVISVVARVLGEAHTIEVALDRAKGAPMAAAVADMRRQFGGLIYPGFVSATGYQKLPDLIRYLRAIVHRLEKAPADVGRDAGRMDIVHRVSEEYDDVRARLGSDAEFRDDVQAVRWMIEELRVSLFAQSIGAAIPVSEQRILAALDRL
ncbi:MAG TPA: ATP-dependent RNA helicase HrpA [Streptosporangiaceae bacterium]|nr:ATP-dependent RNA helicase HrpA [Streptosporangiaceae bacterium]